MWFSTSIWFLAAACSSPPESCEAMCQAAEQLTGSCLKDWELDWNAAGYEDEDAFQNSCDTWVWEQEQLIEAAQRRGDSVTNLEETCSKRTQFLNSDAATCEDIGLWSVEP